MIASVLAAFAIGEAPLGAADPATGVQAALGHGFEHPEFKTMDTGGPGLERHPRVIGVAWVFASFQILFCMSILATGMLKPGGLGRLKIPLAIGTALFLGIFFGLFYSYRNFLYAVDHELFLGVPIPTAWMLFGVWLFPIGFMLLYLATFHTWYLTSADEQRFEAILHWRRAQDAKANASEGQ